MLLEAHELEERGGCSNSTSRSRSLPAVASPRTTEPNKPKPRTAYRARISTSCRRRTRRISSMLRDVAGVSAIIARLYHRL